MAIAGKKREKGGRVARPRLPSEKLTPLAKMLRGWLAEWKLSQSELGRAVKVDAGTVNAWAAGKKQPSRAMLLQVAAALDQARIRSRSKSLHDLGTVIASLLQASGAEPFSLETAGFQQILGKGVLRVGYVNAAPLVREGQGLAIAITDRIARPLRLTLEVEKYPGWEELVAAVRNAEVDISAPILGKIEGLISSEPIGLALRHVALVRSDAIGRTIASAGDDPQPVFVPWRDQNPDNPLIWPDRAPLEGVECILDTRHLEDVRLLSLEGSDAARNFREDGREILHAATEPTPDALLARLDNPVPGSKLIEAVVCALGFGRENVRPGRTLVALPDHLNPSTAMTFVAPPANAKLIEAIDTRLAHMRRFGEMDALITYYAWHRGLEGLVVDPEIQELKRPFDRAQELRRKG